MRTALIGFSLLAAAYGGPALAQSNGLKEAVIRELGCRRSPNPTPIIRRLIDGRFIRLADWRSQNGVSCGRLRQPLNLKGLVVRGVCAADENEVSRKQNPRLYWRGPGAWPGTLISFTTNADDATTRAWAGAILRGGKARIEKSAAFKGMTQIECSSLYQ